MAPMNILVISHFYPPIRDGGYAQLCAEICSGLKSKGHNINVLTSRYGATTEPISPEVHRLLYLENDLNYFSPIHFFIRWPIEEYKNKQIIKKIVSQLKPDIIFIWGIYGFSKNIPATCEDIYKDRVIYYISDLWPINPSFNEVYWSRGGKSKIGSVLKKLLAIPAFTLMKLSHYPPKLSFKHSVIVSEATRLNLIKKDARFNNSAIIKSGSNIDKYYYNREYDLHRYRNGQIKFLFAGIIAHHKGVYTIIKALSYLTDELIEGRISLTIAGSGHPDNEKRLIQEISENNLQRWVKIIGHVPREKMPELLNEHDILIVPSIFEDPLPRMVQEGMLAGLTIIGTTRGGIPEMIDEDTGLLFKAEDAINLSQLIKYILQNPDLAIKLGINGQSRAQSEFSIAVMTDRIESYLLKIIEKSAIN